VAVPSSPLSMPARDDGTELAQIGWGGRNAGLSQIPEKGR